MSTLEEAAEFLSGGTPKKGVPEYWNGDIPWYSASNMDRRFLCDGEPKISKAGLEAGSRLAPQGATLLLVRGSGLFKHIPICFADQPVAFNQDVKAICAKPHIDPTFLHFWIESLRKNLTENLGVTGIGAGKFDTDFLKTLPFPDLSKQEQEGIGLYASSFDRKIDLNRRMNEILEAMVRTIFKDWFVDFGPTRAKMEGREPYLSPELWKLFPDRLDDDGKPKGWEIRKLASITTELRRGIAPKYVTERGILVLNQKCIRNRVVSFEPARRHDGEIKSVVGRELNTGDVLVNSTGVGTLGRVAQIWTISEPMVVDSHITVVRPDRGKVSALYIGTCLTSRESEIEALGEGSTGQTELSRVRLGLLPVLLPKPEVQEAFDRTVGVMINRIEANNQENLSLSQFRDLLIPKLMLGEIQVNGVKGQVGGLT